MRWEFSHPAGVHIGTTLENILVLSTSNEATHTMCML